MWRRTNTETLFPSPFHIGARYFSEIKSVNPLIEDLKHLQSLHNIVN